ncbi:homeobox KN domain-containing protein [Chytriomyces cf. hyalinus JEL632]|nr:homeobox KN domain-containing protein [Chytriomyces cf. hyalinus JEL632]
MHDHLHPVSAERCDALHALSLLAIDLLRSERRASVAVVETVPPVHAFTPLSWYHGHFAERLGDSAVGVETLRKQSENSCSSGPSSPCALSEPTAVTEPPHPLDAVFIPADARKRRASQVSLSGVKRHFGATLSPAPSPVPLSLFEHTTHELKTSQQKQRRRLNLQIPDSPSSDELATDLGCDAIDAATPSGTRSPSIPPSPTSSFYSPSSPAQPSNAFQTASRRLSNVSSTSSSALAPASPPLKSRANFNQAVLETLTGWLEMHKDDPYPSIEQKKMLADQCGLNMKQVNNWFINARRRRLV